MTTETTNDMVTVLTIYTGSDAFGCRLKNALLSHLKTLPNLRVVDLGVDAYYNIASKVGRQVSTSKTPTRGLLFCVTGVGVSIFANKHPGVYAVTCSSVDDALNARSINNCNVLCLSGMNTAVGVAVKIFDAWLNTEFKAACPASGSKGWDDDLKVFLDNSLLEMSKVPYESSNCPVCCVGKNLQFEKANSQGRSKQTRADINLAELQELKARIVQLEDQNHRQTIEMTQLLDRRIQEYMQQYGGRFASSASSSGSGDN